jgi:hypothetical protein
MRIPFTVRQTGLIGRLLVLMALLLPFTGQAQIVISQVYGGGGNAGSTYRNDFIELFNRGAAAVNVTGWTVQYASATGTFSTGNSTVLTGTIQPGQYYLVQEAMGAGGTTNLPTPQATGTIAMSGTAFKIALANNGTAATATAGPTTTFSANVIDFVGVSPTANAYEGASPTAILSNTTAALRNGNGCTDAGNNGADFTVGAPNPRNTSTALNVCGGAPSPAEINVQQAAASIASGGTYSGFAATTVGGTNTKTFTIQNTGGTALTVSNIALSGTDAGDFSLTALSPASPVAAAGSATFDVTFTPSAAGTRTAILTITNSDSDEGSYVINLSAQGQASTPNPEVNVQVAGTDFLTGSTYTGFAATQTGSTSAPVTFTIQNTSVTDALLISSITTTGNFATTGTLPTSIPANSSATVSVTFSPTATGTRTGTLVINSNDQDEATYTIALEGQGTAGPPTLTAINPTSAIGGGTYNVTLTGTNFGTVAGGTVVNFNGGTIVPTTINAGGTSLTVALPVPTTAGSYPVTVTTSTGTSGAQSLTVTAPPAGFFEPFEPATQGAYPTAAAPATVNLRTGAYTFVQALLGNTAGSDRFNNTQSVRIRGGGFVAMNFDKANGAGDVIINAGRYGTDTGATFTLEYSTDGGTTYIPVTAGVPAALTTTLTPYTITVNVPGNVRLRIGTTNTSIGANPRINIDDLQISDYTGPSCTAPTSVAAGSITASSASISFTGSGTASGGYTVTATPAVGAPITASGATSPISLTGLAANTQYDVTVTSNCAAGATATSSPAVSVTTLAAPLNPEINVQVASVDYLTASTYDFGTTNTGTTVPATFTIQNTSATDNLTVSAVNLTGTSFSLGTVALPLVIAPGTSATVTVTFQPTTTGAKTGTLTITSDDQDEPSYVINLTGNATAPPATPTLTAINPSSAVGGATYNVTLTGTNFGTVVGGTVVNFNGGTIVPTTINAGGTSLTVALPVPATAAAYPVTVTTSNGTTAAQSLTVVAPLAGFYEPFEPGTQAGYPTAAAPAAVALRTGSYTFVQALLGSIAGGDKFNNAQAARIRGGGSITMNFDKANGLGTVSLFAATYGTTDTGATFTLAYSTDGGMSFTPIAGTAATLTSTLTQYSYVVNVAGPVRLRIGTTNTTVAANPRISIDDLQITDFIAPPADLTVSTPQSIAGGTYNNITVTGPNGLATLGGNVVVNGAFTVQNGGILDTDCTNTITGPGSFTLEAGGTLSICDPAGISTSGNTGAIRVAGTRSFSSDANYEYSGTVAQVTGGGLPAQVRSLRIGGGSSVTLTSPLGIAKELGLFGAFNTANQLTLLSSATGTAAVGADGGTGSITGTVTVQRYIDPSINAGVGYRHYSSPVQTTSFSDLTTGGFAPTLNTAYNTSATPGTITPFPNVFGYNEVRVNTVTSNYSPFDKGWFVPTGTMEQGRGYTVNIAASQKVDFVGTLELNDVNKTLTRQGGVDGGWHLLGNPYAAPLDMSTVTLPAGINNAIYVFRSTSQYNGTYRAYVNGVGGNPIVSVGQGFFVRATQNGAVFPMSMGNTTTQAAASEDVFQRGTSKPLVQLTLRNAANTLADDAYVYFEQGATTDFDARYDAEKLPNTTGLNLATSTRSQSLAINGQPLLNNATVIPLTVGAPVAGSYVLAATQLTNLMPGTSVLLRDALTGTRTVLKAGTSYRFTLAGFTAPGRFTLEFHAAGALANTAAQQLAAQVQVYPNPASGSFQLALPLTAAKGGVATLTNALGQTVLTRAINAAETTFDVRSLAVGVYNLHLSVNGTTVVRRVVVQ